MGNQKASLDSVVYRFEHIGTYFNFFPHPFIHHDDAPAADLCLGPPSSCSHVTSTASAGANPRGEGCARQTLPIHAPERDGHPNHASRAGLQRRITARKGMRTAKQARNPEFPWNNDMEKAEKGN